MNYASLSRESILDAVSSKMATLIALGVRSVTLVGSYARGQARSDSDIDLLVEFHEGRKSFDSFMDVCDLLESILPRPVHVLTPESVSPYIMSAMAQDVRYEVTF